MAAKKTERNWTLSASELKAVKAEKQPNPYQKGAYQFSVTALYALGKDKWHTLESFTKAFATAAGAEWFKTFKLKESRNDETGKDLQGRIIQNLQVCGQRMGDYAAKMKQLGYCIDLKRDGDTIMVRLNTDSTKPIKLGRVAKADPVKEAKKAKAKAELAKRPPILSGREALAALKAKK